MRCAHLSALTSLALAAACAAPIATPGQLAIPRAADRFDPTLVAREAGVLLTRPPYAEVHANWKERVAQPYVFLELDGGEEGRGEAMRRMFEAADALGLIPMGPPFALLYGDAARARVCLPVDTRPSQASVLRYDMLPPGLVAYAVVAGPYPEIARAHTGLLTYMAQRGWSAGAPVREVYLVNPGEVEDWSRLVTEVQIPWSVNR
ncbi:MAG: GyrI-like domain-containing protein [Planctomycetota bacterium]|nr:GyrI-like domain-containing protein [Planctomycetota bacterium]